MHTNPPNVHYALRYTYITQEFNHLRYTLHLASTPFHRQVKHGEEIKAGSLILSGLPTCTFKVTSEVIPIVAKVMLVRKCTWPHSHYQVPS